MKLVYPACFYPHESNNGYTVVVPDLPGCTTEGDNMVQAIEMAVDAASGWILDELEDGNEIPIPASFAETTINNADSIICLIVLDIERYAEKYGKNMISLNS
ncbi:MAG: type II toxin-antitoxin system HicB family antitoxin [Oscillospiraceae bacterium]|nr:type II toxin-antitoxin system HicB family antitoxin [Oscillospiraceae bacterium]